MEILYNGDVNNQDYFVGWWDQFSTKSAYLLTLITTGMAISGAYEEMEHPGQNAYVLVQERFTKDLQTISKRMRQFSQKAKKEMYDTAKTNINRMLIEKDGKSNHEMGQYIFNSLAKIYPWKLWQVQVYDNVEGFPKHTFSCVDCFNQYLHYKKKYNIVVEYVDKNSQANTNALKSQLMKGDLDSRQNCRQIHDKVVKKAAYTGLHIIDNGHHFEIFGNMGNRSIRVNGKKHIGIAWAVKGRTMKEAGTILFNMETVHKDDGYSWEVDF